MVRSYLLSVAISAFAMTGALAHSYSRHLSSHLCLTSTPAVRLWYRSHLRFRFRGVWAVEACSIPISTTRAAASFAVVPAFRTTFRPSARYRREHGGDRQSI
jgi:hypothetical protein